MAEYEGEVQDTFDDQTGVLVDHGETEVTVTIRDSVLGSRAQAQFTLRQSKKLRKALKLAEAAAVANGATR